MSNGERKPQKPQKPRAAKRVPREPTPEMYSAMNRALADAGDDEHTATAWYAGWDAAPDQPAVAATSAAHEAGAAADPLPDAADVQHALDRMCAPLDESRLSGVTAREDARCMDLIRAHVAAQADEIAALRAKVEELEGGWIAAELVTMRGERDAALKDAERREMEGYCYGLQYAGNLKSRLPRNACCSNCLNDLREQIDAALARATPGKTDSAPDR